MTRLLMLQLVRQCIAKRYNDGQLTTAQASRLAQRVNKMQGRLVQ